MQMQAASSHEQAWRAEEARCCELLGNRWSRTLRCVNIWSTTVLVLWYLVFLGLGALLATAACDPAAGTVSPCRDPSRCSPSYVLSLATDTTRRGQERWPDVKWFAT
jgi:hypothetical protein